MNRERSNRIGVVSEEREADCRADKLAYLRSHQKISFVDTHFHMDRLQRKTGLDRLDPIMIRGPMLHVPSQLEAAVPVFCDEVPTWDKLHMLKQDHRLSFAFGIHPKHVMYVNQHPVGAIKDCFNGPVKEMEKWQQSFPNIMFGFTALILRPERHREISDVT